MEFKHVRKILFEQPYNFCVIIWVFLFYFFFLLDLIKVYDEKVISFCFVSLIELYM